MRRTHIGQVLLCASIAGACLVGGTSASARDIEGKETLEWKCLQQHNEYYTVDCTPHIVLRDSPGTFAIRRADLFWEDILGASPAAPGASPAEFHPRDHRPVALRSSAEIFTGDAWQVPLYSQPTDITNVTRLLQAVLCGSKTDCTVNYGTGGGWANNRP